MKMSSSKDTRLERARFGKLPVDTSKEKALLTRERLRPRHRILRAWLFNDSVGYRVWKLEEPALCRVDSPAQSDLKEVHHEPVANN